MKYINKGHDVASFSVNDVSERSKTSEDKIEVDEVKQFQHKRYVGAVEACWRLRKNAICERKPAVFRQKIHLPQEQTVLFCKGQSQQSALNTLEQYEKTSLTEYFMA